MEFDPYAIPCGLQAYPKKRAVIPVSISVIEPSTIAVITPPVYDPSAPKVYDPPDRFLFIASPCTKNGEERGQLYSVTVSTCEGEKVDFVGNVSNKKKTVGSECRQKEVEPQGNVYSVRCAEVSGTPIASQSDVNLYAPAPSEDGTVGRYEKGIITNVIDVNKENSCGNASDLCPAAPRSGEANMDVANSRPVQDCNAVVSTGVHGNGDGGGNVGRDHSVGVDEENVDGSAGCSMEGTCNGQYKTTPSTEGRVLEQQQCGHETPNLSVPFEFNGVDRGYDADEEDSQPCGSDSNKVHATAEEKLIGTT